MTEERKEIEVQSGRRGKRVQALASVLGLEPVERRFGPFFFFK